MTISQLRKVLDKFNNEDALVWIEVSQTLFPMCGKVKNSMFTYEKKSGNGEKYAEPALVLRPCECSSAEEDKEYVDKIDLN